MGPCTLHVGTRLVLVSNGGLPLVEYALFDASDVELASEAPGIVREAGYRTSAREARRRLEAHGIDAALAEESAAVVRPRLARVYARGPAVRRVAHLLGPAELFDGGRYDAAARRYEGRFLDLTRLAEGAGLTRGAAVLQAFALVALLAELPDDTPVALRTLAFTETARLGERTLRRPVLDGAAALPHVLTRLAAAMPAARDDAAHGPTREALAAHFEQHLAMVTRPEGRARIERIVRGLAPRSRPASGPLAHADLWAIETRLDDGDLRGVDDAIADAERARGPQPGAAYLRARVALLRGDESPRAMAERASDLVTSLSECPEAALLAAQAWLAAGEPGRALPYARDLLATARVPPEVRAAAEAILRPYGVIATPRSDRFGTLPGDSEEDLAVRAAAPTVPAMIARREGAPPPSSGAPVSALPVSPRDPLPFATTSSVPPPPPSPPPARPSTPPASVRAAARDDVRVSQWPASMPAPREEPYRPEHVDHTPASSRPSSRRLLRGASLPAYPSEAPPRIPRAPIVPRVDVEEAELVETLTLPPRATEEMGRGAQMPQSPLEARVRCTLAARKLARAYRVDRGVELRVAEETFETMQRHLLARFPQRTLRSLEEAREAQLHGALASELLARLLGGAWVDVAPSEFGYWAMEIPSAGGPRRVWPFGRVLRLVATGGEDDLVTYFRRLRDLRG